MSKSTPKSVALAAEIFGLYFSANAVDPMKLPPLSQIRVLHDLGLALASRLRPLRLWEEGQSPSFKKKTRQTDVVAGIVHNLIQVRQVWSPASQIPRPLSCTFGNAQ